MTQLRSMFLGSYTVEGKTSFSFSPRQDFVRKHGRSLVALEMSEVEKNEVDFESLYNADPEGFMSSPALYLYVQVLTMSVRRKRLGSTGKDIMRVNPTALEDVMGDSYARIMTEYAQTRSDDRKAKNLAQRTDDAEKWLDMAYIYLHTDESAFDARIMDFSALTLYCFRTVAQIYDVYIYKAYRTLRDSSLDTMYIDKETSEGIVKVALNSWERFMNDSETWEEKLSARVEKTEEVVNGISATSWFRLCQYLNPLEAQNFVELLEKRAKPIVRMNAREQKSLYRLSQKIAQANGLSMKEVKANKRAEKEHLRELRSEATESKREARAQLLAQKKEEQELNRIMLKHERLVQKLHTAPNKVISNAEALQDEINEAEKVYAVVNADEAYIAELTAEAEEMEENAEVVYTSEDLRTGKADGDTLALY